MTGLFVRYDFSSQTPMKPILIRVGGNGTKGVVQRAKGDKGWCPFIILFSKCPISALLLLVGKEWNRHWLGLPFSCTEDQFHDFFKECGEITDSKVRSIRGVVYA